MRVHLLAIWGVAANILLAQSPTDYARQALLRIAYGRLDSVRQELPEWIARHPNNPAILFLHAATLSDAQQAVTFYERIVREFPRSEWSDDALCRLVQYYALRRDSTQAWRLFDRLRSEYPTSDFLPYAWETLRATVGPPPDLGGRSVPSQRPVRYALQVGLFRTRELAEREVARLRQRRLRAIIAEKLWQEQTHYAVLIGDYHTREAAERARETVASLCRCQPIVTDRAP
ncbi:MAG: SPOR domain-containing protein [Candidatus Kapabacteria bacterium]|nr:SPOR domain-containing protein [Candidatus Kapabacteria bacterium]MDW8224437.1 SPOR domain-containing protein [Bacteroidota bacterium]